MKFMHLTNAKTHATMGQHCERGMDMEHNQDKDCEGYVVDGVCSICGAGHGDPCPECGQRAYHRHDCDLSEENN